MANTELFDPDAFASQVHAARKSEALSVHSQCYSPDGAFLATGGGLGTLSVFNVASALARGAPRINLPAGSFSAHDGCIYAMVTAGELLITSATLARVRARLC